MQRLLAILALLTALNAASTGRAALIVGNLTEDQHSGTYVSFPETERVAARIQLDDSETSHSLTSAVLQLNAFVFSTTAGLELFADAGGAGSLLADLGTTTVSDDPAPFTFTPSSTVTLESGSSYWLALRVATPSTSLQWGITYSSGTDSDSLPGATIMGGFAYSITAGANWEVVAPDQRLKLMFQVYGTPTAAAIPEPSTITLTGVGMLGMALSALRRPGRAWLDGRQGQGARAPIVALSGGGIALPPGGRLGDD